MTINRRKETSCVVCKGDKQGHRSSYCIPCMDDLINQGWFKEAVRKVVKR